MKRFGPLFVLLLLAAAPGCLKSTGGLNDTEPPMSVQVKEGAPPAGPPSPPVTAEDITEANAREKLNALNAELDRVLNDSCENPKPSK
jgi:hypothetical protein